MQYLNSATSQEIILIHLFAVLVCRIWHKNRLLPNNVDSWWEVGSKLYLWHYPPTYKWQLYSR